MKSFESGKVKLLNVDCMEYMRTVPDKYFDLAVTDPPYFDGPNKSGYYGKGYSSLGVKRAKHYDSLPTWSVPDDQYFQELQRISKNQIIWGANYYNFIGEPFKTPRGTERFEFMDNYAGWIVWDKDNGASSFNDYELAWTSYQVPAAYFKYTWNGMHQGSMGGDVRKNEKRIHPTQKPKALYDWIYLNYGRKNFKVFDSHSGSAASAISAHYFGFDEYVGTELDPSMFAASVENLKIRTAQEALF